MMTHVICKMVSHFSLPFTCCYFCGFAFPMLYASSPFQAAKRCTGEADVAKYPHVLTYCHCTIRLSRLQEFLTCFAVKHQPWCHCVHKSIMLSIHLLKHNVLWNMRYNKTLHPGPTVNLVKVTYHGKGKSKAWISLSATCNMTYPKVPTGARKIDLKLCKYLHFTFIFTHI